MTALPAIFSQTPLEASWWTMGVALQEKLALFVRQEIFVTAALLVFAFVFVRSSLALLDHQTSPWVVAMQGLVRPLVFLAAASLVLKTPATEAFRPRAYQSERVWADFAGVRANGEHSPLKQDVRGLYFYRLIHGAITALADATTKLVIEAGGETQYLASPNAAFRLIAESSSFFIDDPSLKERLDAIVAECALSQPLESQSRSYSFDAFFNLRDPTCRHQYQRLLGDLRAWAARKTQGSVVRSSHLTPRFGATSALVAHLTGRAEEYQNRVLASALLAHIKERSATYGNLDQDALLGKVSSAPFWITVEHGLSPSNWLLPYLNLFTSGTSESAVIRNRMGSIYNATLGLLPALRGVTKAALAVLFLPAAMALAFGAAGPLWGWVKMAAIFAAYEPLSAMAYLAASSLLKAQSNIAVLTEFSKNPMALASVSYWEAQVANIQIGYFALQILIFTITAVLGTFSAVRSLSPGVQIPFFGTAARVALGRFL